MPIQVALIEDNAGIAEEVQQILAEDPRCVCVATCRNQQTALRKLPAARPDVVITDINLPDGSGIACVAQLKLLLPETQFLMFTVYEEAEQIYRALEAGASGYLLKRSTPEQLLRAIHEIRAGGVPMTGEVARKVIQSFRPRPATATPAAAERLTPREAEILELLAQGRLSKEIADQLAISRETVNSHLKHIYEKLHVRSRTEAVIKYLQ